MKGVKNMYEISNAHWWLLVASFVMTAIAATGVYEALFVMPKWFAAVPKSLVLMRNRDSVKYWIPIQVISIIALIGASLTNWSDTTIHEPLLVGVTSYILVWISTAVFFVPGVIKFQKIDISSPEDPKLAASGKSWLRLSWLRQIAMVVSAISLIVALAAT